MCGIFGLVTGRPVAAAELAAMSRLLRHRGPDDEGLLVAGPGGTRWFGGEDTPDAVLASDVPFAPRTRLAGSGLAEASGVILGHRRLSILDLSPHGHQPMSYRGRLWAAYNGEVYNYAELRRELEARGHRFESDTDTEVILAAYDAWGPTCLSRFNGMWGLAILDLERGTLFLARDRFGVKPLYVRAANGRLAFASEIKAFSGLADWAPRANLPRVFDFLVWNVVDHGAETLFDGVVQVPPGHCALVDVSSVLAGGGELPALRPQPWYELPPAGAQPPEDAVAALREALADAVRLRLRADVPVGSCLSGGLDSSSIVCIMSEALARAGGAPVRTFTARSAEREYDESAYASAVVERACATPTVVTPEPDKLFADLDRLVWHQDEPFVSSSIFAQWCVFEAARNSGVVVMLDGQGADETLCGYRGFFGAYLASLVRKGQLWTWVREVEATRRTIGFGRVRLAGYTAAYLWPELIGLVGRFDRRAYADRGWIGARHRAVFAEDPVGRAGGRPSSLRDMSAAQVRATNLPMLLRWEDRNSMAFSVEARVPFLDYRVVELALRMRDEDKVGGGVSKAVLRQSMRGLVPDAVLDRRDKMGFVTAESVWMRRDRADAFRAELIRALEAMPGIVDPSILARFDDVRAGRRPFDNRFWRVLCVGRWAERFGVRLEGPAC
jgi:asparagine synthase (glutamine-hydrolysing)